MRPLVQHGELLAQEEVLRRKGRRWTQTEEQVCAALTPVFTPYKE